MPDDFDIAMSGDGGTTTESADTTLDTSTPVQDSGTADGQPSDAQGEPTAPGAASRKGQRDAPTTQNVVPNRKARNSASQALAKGAASQAGARANPQGTPPVTDAAQTQQPQYTPEERKRLLDAQAESGRTRQRYEAQLKQQSEQLQRFQQESQQRAQEAERLKLKRWDTQHPEHSKFREVISKVNNLGPQFAAIDKRQDIPPEAKDALKRDLQAAQITPEEESEYRQHQEMTRDFLLNPSGSSRSIAQEVARQEIQAAFQRFAVQQKAETEVRQVMNDKPFMQRNHEEIRARLTRGEPYQNVMELVRTREELAAAKAQLGKLTGNQGTVTRQAAANDVRAKLQRQQATVTRDPKTNATPDYYKQAQKWADEKGLTYDDPKMFRYLEKLRQDAEG